jgi:chromosome segregation ATPase
MVRANGTEETMKSLLFAAGVLALGASVASADELSREIREFKEGLFPYAREHHERCQKLGHEEWELRGSIKEMDQRREELAAQLAQIDKQRAEAAERFHHAEHELKEHCGGWHRD